MGKISILIPMLIAALWGDLIVCIICFCVIRIGYSIAYTSYKYVILNSLLLHLMTVSASDTWTRIKTIKKYDYRIWIFFSLICMDIAGQYAPIIKSICISLYGVGTFMNPVVMGHMVPNKVGSTFIFPVLRHLVFIRSLSVLATFVSRFRLRPNGIRTFCSLVSSQCVELLCSPLLVRVKLNRGQWCQKKRILKFHPRVGAPSSINQNN